MGRESIILGIILIVIGIVMYFYNTPIAIPIGFLVFGVFLIIFWKAEDKIEARKDTKNKIKRKKIKKILGVVKGNTIRTRNIGRDIGAGLKTLVGGEIKSYTQMTTQARDEAFNRMVNEAVELGADAIINIRFTTSVIMQGASEMLAYGTAVKLG